MVLLQRIVSRAPHSKKRKSSLGLARSKALCDVGSKCTLWNMLKKATRHTTQNEASKLDMFNLSKICINKLGVIDNIDERFEWPIVKEWVR